MALSWFLPHHWVHRPLMLTQTIIRSLAQRCMYVLLRVPLYCALHLVPSFHCSMHAARTYKAMNGGHRYLAWSRRGTTVVCGVWYVVCDVAITLPDRLSQHNLVIFWKPERNHMPSDKVQLTRADADLLLPLPENFANLKVGSGDPSVCSNGRLRMFFQRCPGQLSSHNLILSQTRASEA